MFSREMASEPGSHWFKTVDLATGEMVGFVKWQEPRWDGVEVEIGLPEWPAEADRRVCDETFGEWGRRRRELMGGRGHWCEFLVTSFSFFPWPCWVEEWQFGPLDFSFCFSLCFSLV